MFLKRKVSTENWEEEKVGTQRTAFKMAEKFPMRKGRKKEEKYFLEARF